MAGGKRETGWLRSAPPVFLGRISYSLYLLHMPVKEIVFNVVAVHALGMKFSEDNAFIAQALVFVGTLAVTVPLAWLSWRYIELPFVRLGRRLSPVRRDRPAEPQQSLAIAPHGARRRRTQPFSRTRRARSILTATVAADFSLRRLESRSDIFPTVESLHPASEWPYFSKNRNLI
jgi:peptidoglycan/LPS O-acetylase OafA/YrhL